MKSSERMVEVNGVELCAQTFGNADDPAVLLVMGLAASMLHAIAQLLTLDYTDQVASLTRDAGIRREDGSRSSSISLFRG